MRRGRQCKIPVGVAKMASVHARQRRVAAVVALKCVAVMRHAPVVLAVAGAARVWDSRA